MTTKTTPTTKLTKTSKTIVTLSGLTMLENMALQSVSRASGLVQTAPHTFEGTRAQMIHAHRMLKGTDLRGMEWNAQSAVVRAAARLALAGYESEDTRPASEWLNAR